MPTSSEGEEDEERDRERVGEEREERREGGGGEWMEGEEEEREKERVGEERERKGERERERKGERERGKEEGQEKKKSIILALKFWKDIRGSDAALAGDVATAWEEACWSVVRRSTSSRSCLRSVSIYITTTVTLI